MFIDLNGLEDFKYNVNSSAYAYVKDQKLYLKGNVSFEKVMITLAYRKYGNSCYYCKRKFSKKVVKTIDHRYPVIFGGVTILPNLVPCCTECNQQKSNLTDTEYEKWKKLKTQPEQERFRLRSIGLSEQKRINKGTILPKEWFERKKTNILAPINFDEIVYGKKYDSAKKFFWQYEKIEYPVIISRNGIVLDGFISLWVAKEVGTSKIPIIRLENVVVDK